MIKKKLLLLLLFIPLMSIGQEKNIQLTSKNPNFPPQYVVVEKDSMSVEELSYVTEQSNEQLSNQLSEIDSTMKVGNLISTINTYQNYKNNRRLNS